MRKALLFFALIYTVNASAQNTTKVQSIFGKTASEKKAPKTIFSNSVFIKGGFGITSAQVNEWESTTNVSSNSGGGGLSGGFGFGGASSTQQSTYNSVRREFATISFKVGNKWILGSREKWRPGLQLTWFKYIAFVPVNNGDFKRLFSPLMLGFTNIFKLSEHSAIELSGDYGFGFTKNNLRGEANSRVKGIGLSYDFELNYRHKNLTVGIDFSSIHRGPQLSNDWSSLSTIGVSFGIVL